MYKKYTSLLVSILFLSKVGAQIAFRVGYARNTVLDPYYIEDKWAYNGISFSAEANISKRFTLAGTSLIGGDIGRQRAYPGYKLRGRESRLDIRFYFQSAQKGFFLGTYFFANFERRRNENSVSRFDDTYAYLGPGFMLGGRAAIDQHWDVSFQVHVGKAVGDDYILSGGYLMLGYRL